MKVCASRNKEYWSQVFQMPLVVPHFSKGAGRNLKSVTLLKQDSTTGFFVIFLKICRTFFLQNISRRLFLSFWNYFLLEWWVRFAISWTAHNLVNKCSFDWLDLGCRNNSLRKRRVDFVEINFSVIVYFKRFFEFCYPFNLTNIFLWLLLSNPKNVFEGVLLGSRS